MNNFLMKLYQHSPIFLRSLGASIHGLSLRSWRYGPETERLMEEAREREQWSPEKWKYWREERLAFVLHRAATKVPYYREQWAKRRRCGDRTSWENIENWPILEKEDLRVDSKAFVAEDCDVRQMYHGHTGGTTGPRLDVWFGKDVIRNWFALFDLRAREWNGRNRKENWATIGGQPIIPCGRRKPPFWVWNASMHQLYLSVNHINPQTVRSYIDALNRYGVTHIVGYPSSAAFLAREALELGYFPTTLKVFMSIAEPLTPWRRKTLSEGLRCEVRETYGMGERVIGATECPAGTLHQWPELGWLEVVNDESDVPMDPGDPGRLICTSLLNTDMPLIRYSVGDRGRVSAADGLCRCGRRLSSLGAIEGRSKDLLRTRDGNPVYWLDSTFSGLPISEAQVIQERLKRLRIRYVPMNTFSSRSKSLMIDRAKERMGDIEVILEHVREIPRESNGKVRSVICDLSLEETATVSN